MPVVDKGRQLPQAVLSHQGQVIDAHQPKHEINIASLTLNTQSLQCGYFLFDYFIPPQLLIQDQEMYRQGGYIRWVFGSFLDFSQK